MASRQRHRNGSLGARGRSDRTLRGSKVIRTGLAGCYQGLRRITGGEFLIHHLIVNSRWSKRTALRRGSGVDHWWSRRGGVNSVTVVKQLMMKKPEGDLLDDPRQGRKADRNQDPAKDGMDSHIVPGKPTVLFGYPDACSFQVDERQEEVQAVPEGVIME